MKYLEAVLNFLTTLARLLFRGKRKHQPGYPPAEHRSNTGCAPKEHGSSPGCHRSDTIVSSSNSPTPENLMGWALIVCGVSGYVIKWLI